MKKGMDLAYDLIVAQALCYITQRGNPLGLLVFKDFKAVQSLHRTMGTAYLAEEHLVGNDKMVSRNKLGLYEVLIEVDSEVGEACRRLQVKHFHYETNKDYEKKFKKDMRKIHKERSVIGERN